MALRGYMCEQMSDRWRRKTRSDRRQECLPAAVSAIIPPSPTSVCLSVCLMRAKGNHTPSKGEGQWPGGEHASARTRRGRPAGRPYEFCTRLIFYPMSQTAVRQQRWRSRAIFSDGIWLPKITGAVGTPTGTGYLRGCAM